MELRNLYSFLRVAEMGSFTRAADDLGYAQSTVTTQIQQLEMEIGAPLFERIGKKVLLTEKGQELIPYANQMLYLEQQIKNLNESDASIQGTIRIGVVESIMKSLVLAVIKRYREQYPRVSISIIPAVTKSLFESLRHNEVDLILAMGQMMEVRDCVRVCSHPERAVFVAAPEHPLSQRNSLTLREVLDAPMIEIGSDTFLQQQLYEYAAEHGTEITSFIQTESSSIIVNLVRQNLGVAFLPEYLVHRSPGKERNLVILPVEDFSFSFYTHIFYHKNKWISPQMKGLIHLVREHWNELDSMK